MTELPIPTGTVDIMARLILFLLVVVSMLALILLVIEFDRKTGKHVVI